MRAIIVDAGIYGLLTALHLRKEGVDVVVLERGSIPNPPCTSVDRDRMIRATHPGQPGLTRRLSDPDAGPRHNETLFSLCVRMANGLLALASGASAWRAPDPQSLVRGSGASFS